MTDALQVEGAAELAATMTKAGRELNDFSEAARKTAELWETRGRTTAPRRTGALGSSVRGVVDGNDANVVSGLAYSNRTHWGYKRFNQRPQPWLVDARDAIEGQVLGFYEDRAQNVLDDVKGA